MPRSPKTPDAPDVPDVMIRAALKDSGGDVKMAADALKMKEGELNWRIRQDKRLQAVYHKDGDTETPPLEPDGSGELAPKTKRAMVSEEKELTYDNMRRLGISDKLLQELDLLGSFSPYTGEVLLRTMSLCHGGTLKGLLLLLQMIDDISDKQLNMDLPEEATPEQTIDYLKTKLRATGDLTSMVGEVRKTFGQVMNNAAIIAKINAGGAKAKSGGKPGFKPVIDLPLSK